MKHAIAISAALAVVSAASPASAWEMIGKKKVNDRVEKDMMTIGGPRHFERIKVCVYRHPVHFFDIGVLFGNGARQDIAVASRFNSGDCTQPIDLKGEERYIMSIAFRYEETSKKQRTAMVKVFAE